ncbi:hypothetical protein ACUXV3_15085 [Roseobacteraceae bacterium NS-SX3]
MRNLLLAGICSFAAAAGSAREHDLGRGPHSIPQSMQHLPCVCLQVCAMQQGANARGYALPGGCRQLHDRILLDRMAGCACDAAGEGNRLERREKGR